ncbi:MAG: hypothetical protein HY998_01040 [candidate division NC10 bacterium]|nr:hypothetical protein [candidate division NC10 bacterium]
MKSFEEVYKFGTFDVEGVSFPRFLLGTSPFIGAGQFGPKSYFYYRHFYEQPANITKIIIECVEAGCNAVQAIGYPPILEAVGKAMEDSDAEIFLFGTVGLGNISEEVEAFSLLKPSCLVIHGSYTDKNLAGALHHLKEIRRRFNKIVTGVSVHMPGIVIEKTLEAHEVQIILTPINKKGAFMRPTQGSTLQAIEKAREAGKRVIAMKALAAGDLSPDEAFPYLKDKVDGLTVGLTSEEEIKEALGAAAKFLT